ncbi:unnamed protein product [Sphagnum troendelagicum]
MLFFMLEIVKGVKLYNAAIAAVSAEQQSESGGDSYCCLDYAQVMAVGYLEPYLTSSFCAFLFVVSLTHAPDVNFFHANNVDGQIGDKVCILRSGRSSYVSLLFVPVYNILQYPINFVKQKIKDQLEHDNTTQEYSTLHALCLVNPFDENLHCENCETELMAESDKLAAAELGDGYGEDNAHCGKLKELLEKMDVSTTYTSPVCEVKVQAASAIDGATVIEDNVGGTGEFEGEDEIDCEEG